MFKSEIRACGSWFDYPLGTRVRIMMMPVRLEDPSTLPLREWRPTLARLVLASPIRQGVGYLTIDEALVPADETHRRPGLHVDGIGPDGRAAAWGGGGGS